MGALTTAEPDQDGVTRRAQLTASLPEPGLQQLVRAKLRMVRHASVMSSKCDGSIQVFFPTANRR
jgi:hypothetical protein